MRILVLLALVAACGSATDSPLDDAGPDSGTNADSGTPASGFDDCDLGIASSGGIIEYGQPTDYLVELGRGDTRVNLARKYVDFGVGESKIFGNAGFAMKHDGVELCVKDESQLAYENSHHNWIDAAEATEGGVRYRLEMTLDWEGAGGWKYELFGFDAATGAMTFGPIGLDLLSGPRWP